MNNRIIDTLINSTEKTKKSYLVFGSAAVILMISLVTVIIYKLGGTGTAITHLMYIPIIISVFVLGIKGGVASAVAAGLALGPFMPRDVQNGIMQSPYSWIFRMSMFNIIVLLVGLLAGRIRRTEELEKAKAYESIIEGYPNFYKLKHDLTKLTSIDDETTFTLVLFNFTNRQMVDRYVNYDIGLKAMTDLLKKAVDFFSEGIVYCVDTEKFIVVLPETNIENAVEMSESFCSENKRPIYIENLPVSVKLKSGIINYPESGTDLNIVLMNLDKALGYACRVQNDIEIYNEKLALENSRYYNEIVSLYDALQKDKFMLVYQPKINIKNDDLEGVEALLRWNDTMHMDMSIEKLIKLAEDAGFIGEITRWVVKNTIKQIKPIVIYLRASSFAAKRIANTKIQTNHTETAFAPAS
jgi:predicted signal transduction protein with EAL and GGDEF domain